ncbi:MAG: VTT domain-containing protein [Bacillota bacterium]|nr:VTT domain-containing protein [Bacillota bacterium]
MNELADLLLEYGAAGLIVVAFAEASFFPVPPDALLIPLVLVEPRRGIWYAFLCTVASAGGGLFGHFLGKRAGRPLLERLSRGRRLDRIEDLFQKYGGWAVAFAALTPIPYKVFTIAAGVFLVRRRVVFVSSLLGRGLRFFFEALLVDLMGPAAVNFLKRYSEPVTFGLGVLLLGAAVWYTWYRQRYSRR